MSSYHVPKDHGLTAKYLRTLYTLDKSGVLRYRRRPLSKFKDDRWTAEHNCNWWNAKYAGKIVGTVASNGHQQTHVPLPDGSKPAIQVHNIIWCMRTGEWPTNQIDHKNLDKLDNGERNLRIATASQQNMNKARQRNNTSGVVGVSRYHDGWQAYIAKDRKRTILYRGDSFETAVAARKRAESNYFGEFARKAVS